MEEEDIRHQRTLRLQRSAGNVSTDSHYVALSDQTATSSKHAVKVCPSILVQVSEFYTECIMKLQCVAC